MKRRRTESGFVAVRPNAKRPIDKELKVVLHGVTNTLTNTALKTTTFPGTVTGLRWSMSYENIISTDTSSAYWAIVVVPDGESANTPATSDGADFYTPEQHVLAFGIVTAEDSDQGGGPITVNFEGSTKTMRKLKQGDTLNFIALGTAANCGGIRGIVQFFFKT